MTINFLSIILYAGCINTHFRKRQKERERFRLQNKKTKKETVLTKKNSLIGVQPAATPHPFTLPPCFTTHSTSNVFGVTTNTKKPKQLLAVTGSGQ